MTAYCLNLADLLFTLHALAHGAVEANPLMQSVPVMVVYKLVIVGAAFWWLTRQDSILARLGIRLCAAVFACVDIWHIINIF